MERGRENPSVLPYRKTGFRRKAKTLETEGGKEINLFFTSLRSVSKEQARAKARASDLV